MSAPTIPTSVVVALGKLVDDVADVGKFSIAAMKRQDEALAAMRAAIDAAVAGEREACAAVAGKRCPTCGGKGYNVVPVHWRGCDGSCSAGRCPEAEQEQCDCGSAIAAALRSRGER